MVPAHHMNKRHWVSIILDGSMTEEQVFQLIAYTLTQPKRAASTIRIVIGRGPGGPLLLFCRFTAALRPAWWS
ncbi:hypothetical protein NIA69_12425 [Gemmiger formicilis]|nr:hypothetical protein [Gemmiger formicilis]